MLLFYQCYSYFNVLAYDMLKSTSTRKSSINLSNNQDKTLNLAIYFTALIVIHKQIINFRLVRWARKKIGIKNYINSFIVMLAEFSLFSTVSVVAIYSSLDGLSYHFWKQRGIRRTRWSNQQPLKGIKKILFNECLAFLLQSCKPSRQNQRNYSMPIIFMSVEVLSWFREQNKIYLDS